MYKFHMSNLKHILPYGQDQMKEYQLCLDLPGPRGAVKKMWEGQDPFAPANFTVFFVDIFYFSNQNPGLY